METLKTRAISIFAQESLPPFSSSHAGESGTSASSTSSLRSVAVFAWVIRSSSYHRPQTSPRFHHSCTASQHHPHARVLPRCRPIFIALRQSCISHCADPLCSFAPPRVDLPRYRLPARREASTKLRHSHTKLARSCTWLRSDKGPSLSMWSHPTASPATICPNSGRSSHLSMSAAAMAWAFNRSKGTYSQAESRCALCRLTWPRRMRQQGMQAIRSSSHMKLPSPLISHIQAIDDDMGLDLLDAPGFGEQTQRQQQRSSEDRRFLWPVSLCLVALDPRRAAWSSPWPGASATNDLHTIRSEPVTPLKELVSFTLKVLNDANESVAAQSAPPFTPGEPDDVSLTRHRGERISSARPGITPASMSFADFDLAMPSAASVTPSQSLPTVPRTDSQTSPEKRDHAGAEAGPSTNSADQQFADDLSWMEFLPQATGEVPGAAASAAAMPASSVPVGSAPTAVPPASSTVPAAQAAGEVKGLDLDPSGSNWAFATGLDAGGDNVNHLEAKQDPASLAAQALLQPQGRLHSSGSTPFQGQAATPLSFGQTQTKRKGEGDIFGNLGLLTEDDFSFFDESAFGLESPSALAGEQGAMSSHLDPSGVSQADVSANATAHQHGSGRGETSARDPSGGAAAQATSMSATSAGIGDVEMEDLEATNLDALFGAIPSMQDVMGAESSQMRASEPPPPHVLSAPPQHPRKSLRVQLLMTPLARLLRAPHKPCRPSRSLLRRDPFRQRRPSAIQLPCRASRPAR